MIRVNAQYDVEYRPGMTVQDVLDTLKFSFRMIVVKIDGKVVLKQGFRGHRGARWYGNAGDPSDQRGINRFVLAEAPGNSRLPGFRFDGTCHDLS